MEETERDTAIALLEHRIKALEEANKEYHVDLKDHMDKEEEAFKKLWERIDSIVTCTNRYGGIATGVALAVSTIWAVGIAAFAWVRK